MDKAHYFIATGVGDVFYTLRYSFTERTYFRGCNGGAVCGGWVTREYHIQNLSLDRDEAIAKAKEIVTKRTGNADMLALCEVVAGNKRAENQDRDWSIFQGGKYAGKSIHEVAEIDRKYLVWLSSEEHLPAKYQKTAELAKALVQHELNALREFKAQKEAEGQERLAKAKPVTDAFTGLKKVITHEKAGYGFTKLENPKTVDSWGAQALIEAIKANRKPHPTIVSSAIEDKLKSEGLTKRGKKNQAAYAARYQELETLINSL